MQARIIILLALMGIFSVGSAYATTHPLREEEHLLVEANSGNLMDVTKLHAMAKAGDAEAKLAAMAKSGDAVAQVLFGLYWFEAKKDYTKAVYWYEKAAVQGNSFAEDGLGNAYLLGLGVPKDYAKAVYWFKKAAAQGNSFAEYGLGWAYYYGQGVPMDYAKAVYWYEKSAAQGNSFAEYGLGNAYYQGHGVPKDNAKANALFEKAVYWFKKASAQGNAGAEAYLGYAYYFAYGVPRDYAKAVYWFKKASAQGNVALKTSMAELIASIYQVGRPDFPQNQTKAIYWWDVYAGQDLHLLSTWPLHVLKPYILATIGWGPILFFHNTASDIGFGIPFLLSCMILVWKRKSLYHTLHWVIPGFFIAFIWTYLSTVTVVTPEGLMTDQPLLVIFTLPFIGSLIVIISRLHFSWLLSYPLVFFSVLLGSDVLHVLQLYHFNFDGYWYLGIGGAGFFDGLFTNPLLALLYAFITMRAFKAIIRYRNRRSPQVST